MTVLNSVTVPQNVKGGTLWDFLTSIVLQNIETNQGGPFGAIQKKFKKSFIMPKKNLGEKHLDSQSVFSRLWTSVLFLFVLARF